MLQHVICKHHVIAAGFDLGHLLNRSLVTVPDKRPFHPAVDDVHPVADKL
jgi:hypothetical protein